MLEVIRHLSSEQCCGGERINQMKVQETFGFLLGLYDGFLMTA